MRIENKILSSMSKRDESEKYSSSFALTLYRYRISSSNKVQFKPNFTLICLLNDFFSKMSNSTQLSTCKLVVLGDRSVGKSSVLMRYVEGVFKPNQECTIGAAFLTKIIRHDEKNLKFEIWVGEYVNMTQKSFETKCSFFFILNLLGLM